MNLSELFRTATPSVVAFAQTLAITAPGDDPLAPEIFGTGFVVDPNGIVATNRHVVEAFASIPHDPRTNAPAIAAILFHYGKSPEGKDFIRMVAADIKGFTMVDSFSSDRPWFGETLPDIGFVQLKIRDIPALQLATQDHYLEIGMDVSTIGFPLGSVPLTMFKKLNQYTPFIRKGIVSSVFPFPIARPHGFTMDIMQQGGSSGSPVFSTDSPVVLGMMSASLRDYELSTQNGLSIAHPQNTNISICVPSEGIHHALEGFKSAYPLNMDGVITLEEHLRTVPMATAVGWDVLGLLPPTP